MQIHTDTLSRGRELERDKGINEGNGQKAPQSTQFSEDGAGINSHYLYYIW